MIMFSVVYDNDLAPQLSQGKTHCFNKRVSLQQADGTNWFQLQNYLLYGPPNMGYFHAKVDSMNLQTYQMFYNCCITNTYKNEEVYYPLPLCVV